MTRLFPVPVPGRPVATVSSVPGLSRSVPLPVLFSTSLLAPLAVGPRCRALAEPDVGGTDLVVVPCPVRVRPALVSCSGTGQALRFD